MAQEKLPNFFILGAAKAGTTALYHYLRQHPQIYLSPLKETNFFALQGETPNFRGPGDDDYVNRMSITKWDDYLAQFADVHDETAIGEASPLYLYSDKAPTRIKEAAPDAKLIVILRNPIDRAYSSFLHLVRDGRETTSDFGEALALEDQRIRDNWEHIWHYKNLGLYADQLQRYIDLFGRDRLRLYLYADFRNAAADVFEDVFQFLRVEPTFRPDIRARFNEATLATGARPPCTYAVRVALRDAMYDDMLRVQDIMGRDLSHWLEVEPDDPAATGQTSTVSASDTNRAGSFR